MYTKSIFSTATSHYFERSISDYHNFCSQLKFLADETIHPFQPVLFLCVGSDRITGDCLGPLVGHKIKRAFPHYPYVFGTLKHPVHALNMESLLKNLHRTYAQTACIAIDAALGSRSHVGNITLSNRPLCPGEGVKKLLPSVGDISITGIVNTLHGDPEKKLQETRLCLVNEMADFIASAVCDCFSSRFSG